jgi:hypothetical protein
LRWVSASIAVVGLLYLLVATTGPPAVGLWQDDATYLATARSLAQGTGYRHIEMPGEPLQTKYPVLYPALLAIVFLVWPEYPENLALLLAPGAFLAAGFAVLSAVYLRRVLGASRAWMLAVAALAVLSPEIVSLVRFTMSDLPYAFLSVAALLCLDHRVPSAASGSRRRLWLAASALLMAAAVLTRSFGLTLAAAGVLTLVVRRRFDDAALLAGVFLVAALPWWIWQSGAAQANGAMQTSPFEGYDLSYGLWLPDQIGQLLGVAHQNLFRALFGLGFFQLALPRDWAMEALREPSWGTAALHLACYAAGALVVTGWVGSLRRGPRTLHLYLPLYAAVMLAWPFSPYRFLVCWTPFLLYFAVSGAQSLTESLTGGRTGPRHRGWPVQAPAGLLCAALFIAFLQEDVRIAGSTPERYAFLRGTSDLSDRAELATWLRAHTEPGGVIATNDTADLFLAVGRQTRDTSPGVDPIPAFYGRDRSWRSLYVLEAPSETQWLLEHSYPHLEELFRRGDVTHYVHRVGAPRSVLMTRFTREHPGWFRREFSTARGQYRVSRVTAPGRRFGS